MSRIKIAFVDFWDSFDSSDNFIVRTLSREFDVEVAVPSDDVDILFYSCFGRQMHHKYLKPIRIYFTGENDIPNLNECDYGISFNDLRLGNRHLRLPLYCVSDDDGVMQYNVLRDNAMPPADSDKLLDRDFCSIVVSNVTGASPLRERFVDELSKYRQIAYGGRWRNNVGGPVADKTGFISKYKFNLAFENSQVDGYTTEKIINAYYAHTVPVYWGNPLVSKDFNPSTYIDINSFDSVDDAIDYIIEVDNDPDKYLSYFKESPLSVSPFKDWERQLNAFVMTALAEGKKMTSFGRAKRLINRMRLSDSLLANPIVGKLNILLNGRESEIRL